MELLTEASVLLEQFEGNSTLARKDQNITSPNYVNKQLRSMTESNNIQEIVIPSIVIVALFLINGIVLFFIYRYKKRKLPEFSEEELGTLSNDTKASQN